ncbi:MAG: CoB--CoM heterodisulfide reductase iron-sulfur subunit A family protein [bacterium]|jgi:heterodisulfide reductase subunit A
MTRKKTRKAKKTEKAGRAGKASVPAKMKKAGKKPAKKRAKKAGRKPPKPGSELAKARDEDLVQAEFGFVEAEMAPEAAAGDTARTRGAAQAGKAEGVKRAAGSGARQMKDEKKEDLRIGVFVCNCGTNIAGFLDCSDVAEYARTLPNVTFVRENLFSCSEAGANDIRNAIIENNLNRVIVAACTPITHEPTFRAVCEQGGLNAYHFEFVNIREHCSWVHKEIREDATEKAKDLIRMGVARAAYLEPHEPITGEVERVALVIGGGVSGMTASLELATRGFDVILVEKEKELGGLVRYLGTIHPWGKKGADYARDLAKRVEKHKKIKVYKSSRVTDVKGFIGKYRVTLSSLKKPVTAGMLIVATGAEPLVPEGIYGFDSRRVITQMQMESMLSKGKLTGKSVVMIQCAGSRERGRLYCSRICCMTAAKNALIAASKHKADVTILYRDLMCYGPDERLMRNAKEAGVKFINFEAEEPPVVEKKSVKVRAGVLGRDLELPADYVVLSTPLMPAASNPEISRILKVPLDEYGFFLEGHVKLKPLDFSTDGIFVCGTARWPATVHECLEQSIGAASRASTFLAKGEVKVEPIVSVIADVESCVGCGLCVAVCPYGAIELIDTEDGKKAHTIEVACKGCGTCGATCYKRVIRMEHFTDQQLLAQVRAAFKK